MTWDKLKINLGKTYAKLRIFPKIFCALGSWVSLLQISQQMTIVVVTSCTHFISRLFSLIDKL